MNKEKDNDWKQYYSAVLQRFKDMNALSLSNKDIDWLALAIARLEGVKAAADAIGVTKSTLYTWLEQGLDGAAFGSVIRLSELGDVPLEMLKLRVSAFQGLPQPPPRITGRRSKKNRVNGHPG